MGDAAVRVDIAHLRGSPLYVATSPDVPGLYVVGRTREQVIAKVPGAIEKIRQAEDGK